MTDYKINISDNRDMISHLLLQDADVCKAVADTKAWTEYKTVDVNISFNGVPMKPETLQEMLTHWYTSMESQVEQQMGLVDAANAVTVEAERLLGDKLGRLMDALQEIQDAIDLTKVNDW